MMKTNVDDSQTLLNESQSHTRSLPYLMANDEIQRNHTKLDHLQFLCGYLIKILSNFSFRFHFILPALCSAQAHGHARAPVLAHTIAHFIFHVFLLLLI